MTTPSEPLVRLIYASRMPKEVGPKELAAILQVSRQNNEKLGLTGALCYSPDYFLQCLEGERAAVNEVYGRIVQDERNANVTLLSYQVITERLFGRWLMAYIRFDEVDRAILHKHGVGNDFDPFGMSPAQCEGLLHDTARERAAFLSSVSHGGA